jgi:uncharacterized membrane protein YhaH (DUF805 family)
MTFSEAVKSGFDNYVNFEGRSSRPAYWWWLLFTVLATLAADIIDAAVFDVMILSAIVGLGLLLPGLAVSIRRLHDTDRSGWWILIGLIPLIGFIVLLVFYLEKGDETENRFGPPPATTPPATSVA